MTTIQQRRERSNRQINERLRTLIAAYKTLGGSFTGDLTVDPRHLRQVRGSPQSGVSPSETALDLSSTAVASSDRTRRIRDAVEAALSDIVLLGTDEQVRLACKAANELVGGRPVETHALVVSLRNFIREALDLDPIPDGISLPPQGPARPGAQGGKSKGEGERDGARQGGGGGGMGMGMGGGMGSGVSHPLDEEGPHHHG